MATYYVDFTGGADINNGTAEGTPWKHAPGDTNATDVPAAATITAGDLIWFKGGVSYLGTVKVSIGRYNNGSAGNLITLKSAENLPWGTGRAVIDGETDSNGAGGRGKGIWINRRSYIRIEGLEIKNMKNEADSAGVFIDGVDEATYCEIVSNLIHDIYGASGSSGYGIEVTGEVVNGYHLIEKNIVYHTEEKQIEIYRQKYCTIRYNYCHSGREHSIVIGSSNNEIYNNIIANAGIPWGPYGNLHPSYGLKIDGGTPLAEYNNVYNNLFWGCQCALGIMNADNNNIFENTTVYSGFTGGEGGGDEGAGFGIRDTCNGNVIENNIFYYSHVLNSYSAALYYDGLGDNNQIKNNLFYYDPSYMNIFFDNSLVGVARWTTLAAFEGAAGFSNYGTGNAASGNIVADPEFVGGTGATLYAICPEGFASDWTPANNNLRQLAGSVVIDAGLDLGIAFNTDIDALSRPQGAGWDIGAYEGTGAAPYVRIY